jgi:hypothetical protein
MKEHTIVTKLRHSVESLDFSEDDVKYLINAYDDVCTEREVLRSQLHYVITLVDAADKMISYQGTVRESEMHAALNEALDAYYNRSTR